MGYVDGFVLVVPKRKIAAYRKMAAMAGKVWREHGALDFKECVLDDAKVMMGIPFPKLAKLKKGETALFSFIVYKSRAQRDKVNAKVMKDKRITGYSPKDMPFDPKRMSYGGFKVLVQG
jgi:uncharacterized protein YbaA (DUF1428 family)